MIHNHAQQFHLGPAAVILLVIAAAFLILLIKGFTDDE